MARGTILLALALMLAPSAVGQKLRSAEDGTVPLTFGAFAPAQSTVTVKPGDVVWSEIVYPAKATRLIDATVRRVRPIVEGVPAGTLLFGYRLSTGYAYCPPLDVARPTKDVQCYRDLDGDGTFDGGYISGEQNAKNPYFSTFLKGLQSVPKYKYETVAGSLLPPANARIVFAELKNGAPRFRFYVGQDPLKNLIDCQPVSAGVCDVLGVRLQFAPAAEPKGALTFTFTGAAPERTIDIFNSSNPLKL